MCIIIIIPCRAKRFLTGMYPQRDSDGFDCFIALLQMDLLEFILRLGYVDWFLMIDVVS